MGAVSVQHDLPVGGAVHAAAGRSRTPRQLNQQQRP
jgi:hypothetical protein